MSQQITKTFHGNIEKAPDGFDARFVMSSTSADLDRDTIDLDALKENVGKRVIALFAHKHDQPIGFWENVKMSGEKLVGDLKIAGTNLGKMLKQLLSEDVPLAASIGFTGAGEWKDNGGIHFTKVNILECSVVSVPANPDAQRIAKSFGVDLSSFEIEPTPASGPSEAVLAAISAAKRSTANANLILRNRK